MVSKNLEKAIRDVVDFPKKGIIFKDITPILLDPKLCNDLVEEMADKAAGLDLDAIVGVESRGFFFGVMLAHRMNLPFIPVRKKGKLPYKTVSYKYDLEYGSAEIEMHEDVIQENWNVLIHDDLLATGGTAVAAAELIKTQKANVSGFAFIVELDFLKGRESLLNYSEKIISLVHY